MSLIDNIAGAITKVENANPSLNNPGNIMDLAYYKSSGGGFRLMQYPDYQTGYNALTSLVKSYVNSGVDLLGFFSKYAPSGHGNNDPVAYANSVSAQTGIPLGVKISDYMNQVATDPGITVADSSSAIDPTMSDSALTGGMDFTGMFLIGVSILGGWLIVRSFGSG